jgi:hypothetical protein
MISTLTILELMISTHLVSTLTISALTVSTRTMLQRNTEPAGRAGRLDAVACKSSPTCDAQGY